MAKKSITAARKQEVINERINDVQYNVSNVLSSLESIFAHLTSSGNRYAVADAVRTLVDRLEGQNPSTNGVILTTDDEVLLADEEADLRNEF